MAVNTYQVQNSVVMSCQFKLSNGALTDPGSVSVKIKGPTGSITTLTYGVDDAVVKDSVGKYHATFTIPSNGSGIWTYQFTGIGGANHAVSEAQFRASPSQF
jgi:hypothetical protein